MTISSQLGRQSYAGDGDTTEFTVPFKFFDSSDLTVILQSEDGVDATLTENVHYTVSGAGDEDGGTVTMETAPASGETLTIILDPPRTQLTDYVSNDAFPAESHERALDRLTQQNIRTRDIVNRALRLPDGDASVMPTLPGAAIRAGKFLRFDNHGDPEMATGIDQSQTLSQSVIGQFLYPQTPAEVSAGVTPVNYAYPPGHLYRYASSLSTLGSGSADDTAAFTAMLSFAGRKYIPKPASKYKVDPLFLVSNTWIEIEAGTIITANTGYGTDESVFNFSNGVSNIVIRGNGSIIDMEFTYTDGEDKHCLGFYNASNVWVDGITCRRGGGDGIYVGFHPNHSENIWITNFVCELNRRNGASVTSGKNVWFVNGVFMKNGTTNGTNPKAGIDIEPNGDAGVGSTMDSECDGIYVVNCKGINNGNHDFMVAGQNLDTAAKTISVHIIDCEGDGAGDASLTTQNWLPNPQAVVQVRGYVARNAGSDSYAKVACAIPVDIDGFRSYNPNRGGNVSARYASHIAVYSVNGTDGSEYGHLKVRNAYARSDGDELATVALALVGEATSTIEDIDIEINTDAIGTKRYNVSGAATNSNGTMRRVKFTDESETAHTSSPSAASAVAYLFGLNTNEGAVTGVTIPLSDPAARVKGNRITARVKTAKTFTLNPGSGYTVGGYAALQSSRVGSTVTVEFDGGTNWRIVDGGDGWEGSIQVFPTNDATPSVAGGHTFETSDTTTITGLDDGYAGQEVWIHVKHSVTFDCTGTNLKGPSGADISAADGDVVLAKTFDGVTWFLSFWDCTA